MNTFNKIRKYGSQAAVAVTGLALSTLASAQTVGTGIDSALDAVDLSGVATKVGAAALVIVAIALIFKGPDIAKRLVRKV